uniref:CD81 molecule n=1 Tax=Equus caballus TaxID=9796 RepID=F6Q9S8_HORSE
MLAQGQSSSAKRGGLADVSSGLIFLKKKKKRPRDGPEVTQQPGAWGPPLIAMLRASPSAIMTHFPFMLASASSWTLCSPAAQSLLGLTLNPQLCGRDRHVPGACCWPPEAWRAQDPASHLGAQLAPARQPGSFGTRKRHLPQRPCCLELAGGVILGVALWLRHDPQTTNLLYLELGDKPAPNTFYVGIYILIAVGAVMMFVGFLGCYGAIQESQCLLGTFFTCLVILFACEVAAGIWGFVNKDQIAKDVKQFYDQALQQAVVDDDANNAKAVVKTFHETLNCCGSSTLTALTTSVLKINLCPSGSSVLTNLFKEDCHQRIDELFSGKLYLIGIAAIVVAVIMIFEMILSMVLCCGIRNSSVY